jgi:hypothetical protein
MIFATYDPIKENPINSALYHEYFGPKLSSHLCPSRRCHAPNSATSRRNWIPGGAWGDQGEAAGGLGWAGAPSEDSLTVAELEEEGHPVTRTALVAAAAQDLARWVLRPTPPP